MHKEPNRIFTRDEKSLEKLGINLPFDQYYEKCVFTAKSNDIALHGHAAKWPKRSHQQFAPITNDFYSQTCKDYRPLTHRQLLNYANGFAHYLVEKFASIEIDSLSGHVIPIYLGRSNDMIAAMLGVMRAGAAFLLLDEVIIDSDGHIDAEERFKSYWTEQVTAVRYCITTHALWQPIMNTITTINQAIKIQPIFLDDIIKEIMHSSEMPFKSRSQMHQLAYVAFSSGTSSAPKGIQINHSGLVSRLLSHYVFFEEHGYDMQRRLSVPLLAPLRFDAAIMQILLGLGCCGNVLVVDEAARNNMPLLLTYLQATKISAAILIPDQFRELDKLCKNPSKDLPALRIILSTGEAFDSSLLVNWLPGNRLLINGYGPTEMTIGLTLGAPRQQIEFTETLAMGGSIQHKLISVGQPMLGTQLLLVKYAEELRENQELEVLATLKPGKSYPKDTVDGEIIALDSAPSRGCRAACYTNQPATQARNFIQIKKGFIGYRIASKGDGVPAYRTGDRAQIIKGELCILGRFGGKQYKKNGRLLRLEEVENVLENYLQTCKSPAFNAVTIRYRENDRQLIAYLHYNPKDALPPDDIEKVYRDLRDYAKRFLELYMIPSRWLLTTIAPVSKASTVPPQFPSDSNLQCIYRQGQKPQHSVIAELVRASWQETFEDLIAESINSDTQFDELGGDSQQYTFMLQLLKRKLVRAKIVDEQDYTQYLQQILRSQRKFSAFIDVIDKYCQQKIIAEQNITLGMGKQFGSNGALFLFRSPFGNEHYINLTPLLCQQFTVYEVDLQTQANIALYQMQLETTAQAIIKKMSDNKLKHIILAGHSAGGIFAYRVAQNLAKLDQHNHVIVLILDTLADAFAQRTSILDYIEYHLSCLFRILDNKNNETIRAEFSQILLEGLVIESENKLHIIELAERYLLKHSNSYLTYEKIVSITNFYRMQLIPDLDAACHKNVYASIIASNEYEQLASKIEKEQGAIKRLLWSEHNVLNNNADISEIKRHEDFIAENFVGAITEDIVKIIKSNIEDLECNLRAEKIGHKFKPILMRTIHNELAYFRLTNEAHYLEAQNESLLLGERILTEVEAKAESGTLKLLLSGISSISKKFCLLNLSKQLLDLNQKFTPVYVNMAHANTKGFTSEKQFVDLAIKFYWPFINREDRITKDDLAHYFMYSNCIYLLSDSDRLIRSDSKYPIILSGATGVKDIDLGDFRVYNLPPVFEIQTLLSKAIIPTSSSQISVANCMPSWEETQNAVYEYFSGHRSESESKYIVASYYADLTSNHDSRLMQNDVNKLIEQVALKTNPPHYLTDTQGLALLMLTHFVRRSIIEIKRSDPREARACKESYIKTLLHFAITLQVYYGWNNRELIDVVYEYADKILPRGGEALFAWWEAALAFVVSDTEDDDYFLAGLNLIFEGFILPLGTCLEQLTSGELQLHNLGISLLKQYLTLRGKLMEKWPTHPLIQVLATYPDESGISPASFFAYQKHVAALKSLTQQEANNYEFCGLPDDVGKRYLHNDIVRMAFNKDAVFKGNPALSRTGSEVLKVNMADKDWYFKVKDGNADCLMGREYMAMMLHLFMGGDPQLALGWPIILNSGDHEHPQSIYAWISEGFDTESLGDVMENSPHRLSRYNIDMMSFGQLFITDFLICPEDGNPDHFKVLDNGVKIKFKLIDYGQSFIQADRQDNRLFTIGKKKDILNIKTMTFLLDAMDNELPKELLARICLLDIDKWYASWVGSLVEINKIFKPLLEKDGSSSLRGQKGLSRLVDLNEGSFFCIKTRMQILQHFIRSSKGRMTGSRILFELEHLVALKYQSLRPVIKCPLDFYIKIDSKAYKPSQGNRMYSSTTYKQIMERTISPQHLQRSCDINPIYFRNINFNGMDRTQQDFTLALIEATAAKKGWRFLKLNLSGCAVINSDRLINLLEKLEALEILDISHCKQLRPITLIKIFSHDSRSELILPELKLIRLSAAKRTYEVKFNLSLQARKLLQNEMKKYSHYLTTFLNSWWIKQRKSNEKVHELIRSLKEAFIENSAITKGDSEFEMMIPILHLFIRFVENSNSKCNQDDIEKFLFGNGDFPFPIIKVLEIMRFFTHVATAEGSIARRLTSFDNDHCTSKKYFYLALGPVHDYLSEKLLKQLKSESKTEDCSSDEEQPPLSSYRIWDEQAHSTLEKRNVRALAKLFGPKKIIEHFTHHCDRLSLPQSDKPLNSTDCHSAIKRIFFFADATTRKQMSLVSRKWNCLYDEFYEENGFN